MSKGGLTAREVTSAKLILSQLENQPESIDFLDAVDYQTLNLPDYPEIIAHPMDLGIVSYKLEVGLYRTMEEVCADLQLIWDNCRTYNAPKSLIVRNARKLEQITQKYQQDWASGVSFEELVDLAESLRRGSRELWALAVWEVGRENETAQREFSAEKKLVSLSGISRELYERLKNLAARGK